MVILSNCKFIESTSTPTVSKTFVNAAGDVLSLQIDGAQGVYRIEGRNSADGDWVPLAGISLSDFSVKRDGFNVPGLYEIGITSVRQLRATVESAQGEVTIFGQIISTGEM